MSVGAVPFVTVASVVLPASVAVIAVGVAVCAAVNVVAPGMLGAPLRALLVAPPAAAPVAPLVDGAVVTDPVAAAAGTKGTYPLLFM